MIDGMRANGVSRLGDVAQDLRVAARNLANREEGRLGALGLERGEDRRVRPGSGPSSNVSTTSFGCRKSYSL